MLFVIRFKERDMIAAASSQIGNIVNVRNAMLSCDSMPTGWARVNSFFSSMPEVEEFHVEQIGRAGEIDRKSTHLNSSHVSESRMPSSA